MRAQTTAGGETRRFVGSKGVTRCLATAHSKRARAALQQVPQPLATAVLALALQVAPGADAAGLESIELPSPPSVPNIASKIGEKSAQALQEAEESFQNSDLLAILKENSETNRDKNKKAIEEKYCQRQGEMGVGDCGGLRFIPGATKSGKQRTPGWLANFLGIQQDDEDAFEFSMTKPATKAANAPDSASEAPSDLKASPEVSNDPEVQAAVEILEQNDEPKEQIEGVLDAIEQP